MADLIDKLCFTIAHWMPYTLKKWVFVYIVTLVSRMKPDAEVPALSVSDVLQAFEEIEA